MLLKITRSPKKNKKFRAYFSNGHTTDFGAAGYGDFIIYSKILPRKDALKKRNAYIQRHAASRENWDNPETPGALSRWLLWEKPTMEESLRKYTTRFFKKAFV
jgi:Family of unknown function (DUF5754)